MPMREREQIGFSTLWDGYASDAAAKAARDARYREEKQKGNIVKRWSLPNQIKKYAGLGQPDGRSCTVYMLNIELQGMKCTGCGFAAEWHGVQLVDGLCADCRIARRGQL